MLIVCKWSFYLCGIAWKNITERGRGGACVPARVALQGRIHHSSPRAQCVCFWYGNAATPTFGRAHRHRPYGFVWEDCMWTGIQVFVYAKARSFIKSKGAHQMIDALLALFLSLLSDSNQRPRDYKSRALAN